MRTIKPGFFRNEELGALPPIDRLLFAGIWCWCDREGRIEDRVNRIKVDVLPYDNVTSKDVDDALDRLVKAGFLIRYTQDQENVIQVLNWTKHQSPHHKEADSVLAPYKHGESTVKAHDLPPTSRVGSGLLVVGNGLLDVGRGKDDSPESSASLVSESDFHEWYKCYPYKVGKQQAIKTWNKLRKSLPPLQDLIGAVEDQKTWPKDCGAGLHPDREARIHPSTWLNSGRWEDESPAKSKLEEIDRIPCPDCDGQGYRPDLMSVEDRTSVDAPTPECERCQKKGWVPADEA